MAYLNERFQPPDKTTDREKAQAAFQAQLLGIKHGSVDKTSYRRRADTVANVGESATAYETLRRNKREAAAQEAARKKQQEQIMRQINTSIGQGVGPSLTPNGNQFGGLAGNGMSSSFEKFMAAISAQESGGNYRARNKDSGAMGKYQIMPGNLAGNRSGWDFEALGRDVSPQEFLNSPQIQEAIAKAKMQDYYAQYGPRGAAIAWYAGPGAVNKTNLNAPQGKYPSISSYVQSILRRLGL